ncbi:PREDICTED: BRO1 domain-containing protein BROX homolog isoform X2 [Nicotiana attenuata]|uniref:BRO1 domain-containing protein BROX homolog isoform X2 n=1 Tax=Nicotiana attenuata TaxID=49451 RepID=UPI000904BD97|nr:PREDICTED: BRO1 domain-containing protein BROX homolog isoform X2 [Nicotiana attenuata]
MGCAVSVYAVGKKKKKNIISEVSIFVPSMRVPVQCDIQRTLKGVIPKDLADRLTSIRNQIVLIAQDTDVSAIDELQQALEEYLSLLVGLTRKEFGLQDLIGFKWRNLEDGQEEISVANSWFELLSVLHMMAMLTLVEANMKLIPKDSAMTERVVSGDCMRDAVDLLLKTAGYLDFCVQDVLVHLPPDVKNRLPKDLHQSILEATSNQALAQGTEIQLGLALESQNATLSVKRRLACEAVSYYGQALCCLSGNNNFNGTAKKHILFIKWKYLEAKAAAYYYHGIIVDKGTEPSSHASALCCFLAAEELLTESKKAALSFCLAEPVTRTPPPWGVMKHLNKKVPETATRKSQMYGYLLDQEKGQALPELPEFQLSLKPDEYILPETDSTWDSEIPGQSLKEHLKDCEDGVETE